MRSVTSAPLILRPGAVVARVRPWAFEPNVAHLVLYNQTRLPTPADILGWVDQLRRIGYDTIRTGALGPQAGARFERLGFEPIQSLVLLEHRSLGSVSELSPTGSTLAVRLASSADGEASRVDVAAFGPGWCIDRIGIGDVRSATPRHRARASTDRRRDRRVRDLRTRWQERVHPTPRGLAGSSTPRPRRNAGRPTRCVGWHAGACNARSSTRTSATMPRSLCTTGSGSPISPIGSTSTNGGSSESTPRVAHPVRPHLHIAPRSGSHAGQRRARATCCSYPRTSTSPPTGS